MQYIRKSESDAVQCCYISGMLQTAYDSNIIQILILSASKW